MTRSHTEADDLVQEAMLKALQSFEELRQPESAKAWLLAIQRNTHIDRCRAVGRRGHEVPLEADVCEPVAEAGRLDEHWHDPQELLDRFEDTEIIEALKTLPLEIRWTLILVDVEQLDHVQAAQILGVPEGTIKSRAHRGRAMLRDHLYGFAQRRGWIEAPTERRSP